MHSLPVNLDELLREQWFEFEANQKRRWGEEWVEPEGIRATWVSAKRA